MGEEIKKTLELNQMTKEEELNKTTKTTTTTTTTEENNDIRRKYYLAIVSILAIVVSFCGNLIINYNDWDKPYKIWGVILNTWSLLLLNYSSLYGLSFIFAAFN